MLRRLPGPDMMRAGTLTLGALLLSLLAACTGPAPREDLPADWSQHSAQLQAVQHWQTTGKLALRSTKGAESGSMIWQQHDLNTHVQLSGPLGVGATLIDSDGRQMTIRRGDESRTMDISSPRAIAHNTGWALPLQSLPHWLKGLPSPDSEVQLLELEPETGRLKTLRQNDWQVSYDKYRQFESLILPTRIEIIGQDTRATVLLRQWRILPDQ